MEIVAKKVFVLFAQLSDSSSLFSLLPLELITFVFGYLKRYISTDSKLLFSQNFRGEENSPIKKPKGLCVTQKNLYVSDAFLDLVQIFDKNTLSLLINIGGTGDTNGKFSEPIGIEVSNNTQNIFVCDSTHDLIQIFDVSGTFLSQSSDVGSPFTISQSATTQNLYVTDHMNKQVKVLNEEAKHLFSFKNNTDQPSFYTGIKVSNASKVFVADITINRVIAFSLNGDFLFSFGGPGPAEGSLFWPMGITVDEEDNIYVADMQNNRVQIFDKNGTFLLRLGHQGKNDGEMFFPTDVAVDEQTVYVCDSENQRIQLWR